MYTRHGLLKRIDHLRVLKAIQEAERATSGEIRVSVSTFFLGDVRKTAEKAFERLGMTQTQERNGILLFVVPSRRRFAVLGDAGIHAKVGQEFWDGVCAAMSKEFHEGRFTEGLVLGIEEAGRQLAIHFPHRGEADRNELPDAIDFGGREPER